MKPYPYKTPLRYPGGKSRAVSQIFAQFPDHFEELREPFVGGGSVFLQVRQRFPEKAVWINDLNFDLFCFWKEAQRDAQALAYRVAELRDATTEGKTLWQNLREAPEALPDFDRAVRFFVMNRITFSGTIDAGGYSEQAYKSRFTLSSIERLLPLRSLLEGVKITHSDYTELTHAPGEDVLIFLDPPYENATKSKLYGRKGVLHTSFDHDRFASAMKTCAHCWLITYDDIVEIRERFPFAVQKSWALQYGMNNYKQERAEIGAEVFLLNYEIAPTKPISALTLFD